MCEMATSLKEDSVGDKFAHLYKLISKIDDEIDYIGTIITKKTDECEKLQRKINSSLRINICDGIKRLSFHSTVKQIYAENKEKVTKNEELFDKLGPRLKLPLYNLPQDTLVYHKNIKTHEKFKPKLVKFIADKKNAERKSLHRMLKEYDLKMREHTNKLNGIEDSYDWKIAQANRRSLFCQVFPELWKQLSLWRNNKKIRCNKRPVINNNSLSNSYSLSEIFVFHNRTKKEMLDRHAPVPPFANNIFQMDLKFLLINNTNRLVVNLSEEINNERFNEHLLISELNE